MEKLEVVKTSTNDRLHASNSAKWQSMSARANWALELLSREDIKQGNAVNSYSFPNRSGARMGDWAAPFRGFPKPISGVKLELPPNIAQQITLVLRTPEGKKEAKLKNSDISIRAQYQRGIPFIDDINIREN